MYQHADRCQQRRRIVIGAGRVLENAWEPKGIRYTQERAQRMWLQLRSLPRGFDLVPGGPKATGPM